RRWRRGARAWAAGHRRVGESVRGSTLQRTFYDAQSLVPQHVDDGCNERVPLSVAESHIAAVRTFRKPKEPPPEPLPGAVTAIREHPRRAGRYTVEVARVPVGPVSAEAIGELGVRIGVELDARALGRLVAAAREVACY